MDVKVDDIPDIVFDNDLLITFLERLNLETIPTDVSETLETLENESYSPSEVCEAPSSSNDFIRGEHPAEQSAVSSDTNFNYKNIILENLDPDDHSLNFNFDRVTWKSGHNSDLSDDSEDSLIHEKNSKINTKYSLNRSQCDALSIHLEDSQCTVQNSEKYSTFSASEFHYNLAMDSYFNPCSDSIETSVLNNICESCLNTNSNSSEESGYDTSPTTSLLSPLPIDSVSEEGLLTNIIELMDSLQSALVSDGQQCNVPIFENAKSSEEYIMQLKEYFQDNSLDDSSDNLEPFFCSPADGHALSSDPTLHESNNCSTAPLKEQSNLLDTNITGAKIKDVNKRENGQHSVAENTPSVDFGDLTPKGCPLKKKKWKTKFEVKNSSKRSLPNSFFDKEKFSTERKKILRMINRLEHAHGERDRKRFKMVHLVNDSEEKISEKIFGDSFGSWRKVCNQE